MVLGKLLLNSAMILHLLEHILVRNSLYILYLYIYIYLHLYNSLYIHFKCNVNMFYLLVP